MHMCIHNQFNYYIFGGGIDSYKLEILMKSIEKKQTNLFSVSGAIFQHLFLNGWRKLHSSQSVPFFFFFGFWLFAFSRASPMQYRGSQTRGLIGSIITGLCQRHRNTWSKPHLQPTPQLTATPDPQPTEQGQGLNPQAHSS